MFFSECDSHMYELARELTLSKAIGRESFSIGAETEEADDAEFDGAEVFEAAELMDANDDVGRSEYKTS